MHVERALINKDQRPTNDITDLLQHILLPCPDDMLSVPLHWNLNHLLVGDVQGLECALNSGFAHLLLELSLNSGSELLQC